MSLAETFARHCVYIYKAIVLILFISRGSEITYLSNTVVAIKYKREHYMVIYSVFVDLLTRKKKKRIES